MACITYAVSVCMLCGLGKVDGGGVGGGRKEGRVEGGRRENGREGGSKEGEWKGRNE